MRDQNAPRAEARSSFSLDRLAERYSRSVHCGGTTRSRVLVSRLANCRRYVLLVLFSLLIPLIVQSYGFAQESADGPTLYFFTNDHCPPCKQVEPGLLRLAQQGYPITRIDTHVHRAWVERFQVMSTPTVVFVDDNRELARYSGFIDGPTVAGWFQSVGFTPGQQQSATSSVATSNVAASNVAVSQARSSVDDARGTFAIGPRSRGTTEVPSAPPRQITPPQAESVSPYTLTGGPMPETEHEFIEEYTRRRQSDSLANPDPTILEGTVRPDNRIEADAMMATVRLRVEDPQGVSYATGTVIHCHAGEWLILTCGHVFRDSNGNGTIYIDYDLSSEAPRTASGELIAFESEDRDIALVASRTGVNVRPIPIAEYSSDVQRGDEIFSLGCDHGERPTIRRSEIKNQALYNGITKYDIYGRPVDGRSGGGLFTPDGRLIGVCNAAAVDFDEGIYTALDTIYWQLESAGLIHLFEPSSSAGRPYSLVSTGQSSAATSNLANARGPSNSRSDNRPLPNDAPIPNDAPMTSVADVDQLPWDSGRDYDSYSRGSVAPGAARNVGLVQPERRVSQDDLEVLVIVRSRVEPANAQTIRLPNPSPQLLDYLEEVGNQQVEARSIDMARMRLPIQRVRFR